MSSILLSVIIPTLNAAEELPHFLKSLKKQTIFPKIEILISDGGSTDKTVSIGRAFGCKIINNPFMFAEPGVFIAAKSVHGRLCTVLSVDNCFERKDGLAKLVAILENPKIDAVMPRHISSSSDSIYSKYINTFTDPFSHFIYGEASNARTFSNIYPLVSHNAVYSQFNFEAKPTKPIIALNQGFTIRTKLLKSRKSQDDIAPIIELISRHKVILYAHSVSIIHHTVRDLSHFVRKQRWSTRNALNQNKFGIAARRQTLTQEQKIKALLFFPYAFIFLPALVYSLYRFSRDRESLWLFHPFISFIAAFSILWETSIICLQKALKRLQAESNIKQN